MSVLWIISGMVIGLLLAESRVSRRHERIQLARGALAPSGDVYLAMAVVYPLAFVAMLAEGLWRAAGAPDTAGPPDGGPSWIASGALLFVVAKLLKYWAIGALGDRWSFRVLVEPGAPLVATGPYRYVAHPNYIAVVAELVGVALMSGAVVSGPIGIASFGVLLWLRLRFEERALRSAGLLRRRTRG